MDLSVIVDQTNELSLAVDHYNLYPGEQLALFLRFTCPETAGGEVQIILPRVMNIEAFRLPEGVSDQALSLVEREQELIVMLPMQSSFQPGVDYEMEIKTRVNTFYIDQYLLLRAVLLNGEKQTVTSESLQVTVYSKGKYLKYLPEIYESDDFISRFMMLFESFWKPISQQIDQIDSYFDPNLAPDSFIPWLSSWLGLPVDSSLPLSRVRSLLKNAMMFYQCRGTYQALKTYLEVYTTGEVNIIERRSNNFVLGEQCNLGVEIALGTENQPNSIYVFIKIPATELERTGYVEDMYQRKMVNIVKTMVPAHTVFDVKCIFQPV